VERSNFVIPKGLIKVKTTFYVKTDVEGRRLRELTGLVTPVVFAENDECHRYEIIISINESVSISPQE
jgi:hypothetical protein